MIKILLTINFIFLFCSCRIHEDTDLVQGEFLVKDSVSTEKDYPCYEKNIKNQKILINDHGKVVVSIENVSSDSCIWCDKYVVKYFNVENCDTLTYDEAFYLDSNYLKLFHHYPVNKLYQNNDVFICNDASCYAMGYIEEGYENLVIYSDLSDFQNKHSVNVFGPDKYVGNILGMSFWNENFLLVGCSFYSKLDKKYYNSISLIDIQNEFVISSYNIDAPFELKVLNGNVYIRIPEADSYQYYILDIINNGIQYDLVKTYRPKEW